MVSCLGQMKFWEQFTAIATLNFSIVGLLHCLSSAMDSIGWSIKSPERPGSVRPTFEAHHPYDGAR